MAKITQRLPLTLFEEVRGHIEHKIPKFFVEAPGEPADLAEQLIHPIENDLAAKIANRPGGRAWLERQREVGRWLQGVLARRLTAIDEMMFDLEKPETNKVNRNHYYNSRFVNVNEEGILSVQSEGYHRKEIGEMMVAMWFFNHHGRKVFRIEKELTEELVHTDCAKIDDEFFQLPFDSICISLPFNDTIKLLGKNVRQLYIHQHDDDEKSMFRLFAILEDQRFYTEDFFLNGGDIESQIKAQMETKYPEAKHGIEENTKLFSFLTAIILYMNSEDVDETDVVPEPTKIAPASRLPVCSLGRNIVIHQNSMAANPGAARGPLTINVLKWTVRGHFRKQKVGSQRQETRIIWIRPYIKGRERLNDDLDAKPTNYTLK